MAGIGRFESVIYQLNRWFVQFLWVFIPKFHYHLAICTTSKSDDYPAPGSVQGIT